LLKIGSIEGLPVVLNFYTPSIASLLTKKSALINHKVSIYINNKSKLLWKSYKFGSGASRQRSIKLCGGGFNNFTVIILKLQILLNFKTSRIWNARQVRIEKLE
jgi:hypothetical protein